MGTYELSLDEIIAKDFGEKEGMDIYNFISDEVRRLDGIIEGVRTLEGNIMSYKNLFYECYKTIDSSLKDSDNYAGFDWKRYSIALSLMEDKKFMAMKLNLKDENAKKVNKTIDQFYNDNLGKITQINNIYFPYVFSVITYNILTNFEGKLECESEKPEKSELSYA